MSVIRESKNLTTLSGGDMHDFNVDVENVKAVRVDFPAGTFKRPPIVQYTLLDPNNSPASEDETTKDYTDIKFDNPYTGTIKVVAFRRKKSSKRAEISITVTPKVVKDKLGVDQNVKLVSAMIDGEMQKDCKCVADTVTDADAKQKLRDHLDAKNIKWDSEA